MDFAGRDNEVETRLACVRQSRRRPFHVQCTAARQRRHLRRREFFAHRLDRLVLALGSDRESRFEDIDPEFRQLVGHPELLWHSHGTAGRLLAISQGRVEDKYAVAHFTVSNWNDLLAPFSRLMIDLEKL
jgi:hypothetical protein